jgi:hypothetical protein
MVSASLVAVPLRHPDSRATGPRCATAGRAARGARSGHATCACVRSPLSLNGALSRLPSNPTTSADATRRFAPGVAAEWQGYAALW